MIIDLMRRLDDDQADGRWVAPVAVWFRDGYDLLTLTREMHPLRFGLAVEVELSVAETDQGFDALSLVAAIGPLTASLTVQRPRGGWLAASREWTP